MNKKKTLLAKRREELERHREEIRARENKIDRLTQDLDNERNSFDRVRSDGDLIERKKLVLEMHLKDREQNIADLKFQHNKLIAELLERINRTDQKVAEREDEVLTLQSKIVELNALIVEQILEARSQS